MVFTKELECTNSSNCYAQEAATSGQNLMCDPNNPKLKFVNTTESHVCGIPKIPLAITVNSTTPMP